MGRSHGTPPEVVMEVVMEVDQVPPPPPSRSCHGSGHGSGPSTPPPEVVMEMDQDTPPPPQKWSWKWTRVPPSPRKWSWKWTRVPPSPPEVVFMEVDQGTLPLDRTHICHLPSAIHQLASGRFSFEKRISTCSWLNL